MLEGKKIFLLGGASAIGSVVLNSLLENRADVYASYNNKAVEGLTEEKLIHINLNDKDSIEKSYEFLESHTFDGFINCAGINISGPLIGLSDKDIYDQCNINLVGPMLITRSIIKNMVRAKKGSVIHIGSVSAHRFFRGHSIYSATKAGLEGFVQAMASEVAKRGVRVNCILPGPVMTPMLRKSIEENGIDPTDNIPTKKLIDAQEIANMCGFLASDQCPSLTGTLIPIDGGYLLW